MTTTAAMDDELTTPSSTTVRRGARRRAAGRRPRAGGARNASAAVGQVRTANLARAPASTERAAAAGVEWSTMSAAPSTRHRGARPPSAPRITSSAPTIAAAPISLHRSTIGAARSSVACAADHRCPRPRRAEHGDDERTLTRLDAARGGRSVVKVLQPAGTCFVPLAGGTSGP